MKAAALWLSGAVLLGAAVASVEAVRGGALRGGDVAAAWGGGELGRRIALVEAALPDLQATDWERVAVVRTAGSNPLIGLLQQRLYPKLVVPIWQGQGDLERGFAAARRFACDGLVRLTNDGSVELFDVPYDVPDGAPVEEAGR